MVIASWSAGSDRALPALRACPLFAEMDSAELESVARAVRLRRFRRGEVIYHGGDRSDAVFIVSSGSVKILLSSPDGDEAVIETLQPGDFFGELSVLDGLDRAATAIALEASELCSLARDPFLELFTADPGLRDATLAGLTTRLRTLIREVEEVHFPHPPGGIEMTAIAPYRGPRIPHGAAAWSTVLVLGLTFLAGAVVVAQPSPQDAVEQAIGVPARTGPEVTLGSPSDPIRLATPVRAMPNVAENNMSDAVRAWRLDGSLPGVAEDNMSDAVRTYLLDREDR